MEITVLEFPQYASDTRRIKRILEEKGFEATLSQCEELWCKYSDGYSAGWLVLDGEDEQIFNNIAPYIN